ncbi:MAG: deaminase [archaeon]
MLVGITGLNSSGKDTAAEYLENKGFVKKSLSDEIRRELFTRGIPLDDRQTLIDTGNELRHKFGGGILAKRLLASVDQSRNYSFISIRNPEEVEELRKNKNFFLIFIEAGPEKRFERQQKRERMGVKGWGATPKTFGEFAEEEKKELKNEDSKAQQLLKMREMADFVVENNGSTDELYQKIDELLDKMNFVYRRPSWDDYFVELSRTVGKRSTCDRGRFGCVIVKDKRVLATGYVGSPPGQKHCDEAGHMIKKILYDNGEVHQHCVRTIHAEQNALMQAAKLGIPVDGATVYVKMTPCMTCAMLLLSAGIRRVVCEKRYHGGAESERMFNDAGVDYAVLEDKIEKYSDQ